MKATSCILLLLAFSLSVLDASSQRVQRFKPRQVYQSTSLQILQLADNSFQHISWKQTNDFGKVPCNGLVVRSGKAVVVFDTPINDSTATELIQWIRETLQCTIRAVVPTHFHDDCLGGLNAFHQHAVPSYAHYPTLELAKENRYTVPQNSFRDSLVLRVGGSPVVVKFFGEGHTKDNVVGYFPADHILFGGCLIKEVNASKGYLGDANLSAWSGTVTNIKQAYPAVKIVVPGHGEAGNQQLLDYTIQLFTKQ